MSGAGLRSHHELSARVRQPRGRPSGQGEALQTRERAAVLEICPGVIPKQQQVQLIRRRIQVPLHRNGGGPKGDLASDIHHLP